MLKLLIVDDENYDRASIISMLSSDFKETFDISEARNGREAIEISEKIRPDIIIMDIKMPGINGIKAIQEIRKFLPNCYFIILTAYDYFDFAVEAVNNNVRQYILKPFSKSDIVEKLKEGIAFVNAEKVKRMNEIEIKEKLYNIMPIIENELSFAIISNSINSIDSKTYCSYLNMDFNHACSMVVQINHKPSEKQISHDEQEVLKLQVGEHIKEYILRRYKNIASYKFTKELAYFIQLHNYEDEKEFKENVIDLGIDIVREVRRLFGISIKIGLGKCRSGLKEMHLSYEEAKRALSYESDSNKVIHIDDLVINFDDKKNPGERAAGSSKEKIAIFKAVEQYIKNNMTEELDLENTAARYNLSVFYFSRVFKDMLGYNFSDYINKVRIDKAKELLKDDTFSIKEICYSVGYSDPNYFSKVFKKYAGLTPSEYKLKLS